METKDLPEHLRALGEIRDGVYIRKPDDADYADVAFALIKCGDGDKEALNEVVTYVKRQHERLKDASGEAVQLKSKIGSWMMWAENWTTRKPS